MEEMVNPRFQKKTHKKSPIPDVTSPSDHCLLFSGGNHRQVLQFRLIPRHSVHMASTVPGVMGHGTYFGDDRTWCKYKYGNFERIPENKSAYKCIVWVVRYNDPWLTSKEEFSWSLLIWLWNKCNSFFTFFYSPRFYWTSSGDSHKKATFFWWYHLTLIHFTQMFSIFIQLNVLIGGSTLSVLWTFPLQKPTTGARDTQRIRWGKEVLEEFKGIAHVPSPACFLFNSAKGDVNKNPLGSLNTLAIRRT